MKQAGGFILQLLPGTSEETIAGLEERLAQVKSVTQLLDQGLTPEEILGQLLEGMDLEILDRVPTEFYCNCSRERMAKALISIGARELQQMIQEGEPAQLKCHFCGGTYTFSVEELREMLAVR